MEASFSTPERIRYKLGVTVHRCLQHKSPEYLVDCCTPVSDIPRRRHLRSATRHHLTVPPYWLSTFGHRAFSVPGPTVWTCYRTVSATRRSAATVSDNRWRRINLNANTQHTQHSRDASWLCAIYKSIIDNDTLGRVRFPVDLVHLKTRFLPVILLCWHLTIAACSGKYTTYALNLMGW